MPTRCVAALGFASCTAAFWMLLHPYEGLVHDSVLYAFAALSRLHPDSLSHDIYLSVGVQDRYTQFSPIAAAAFRWLGLEGGAALITLVAQLAFFGSAWLLARRLMQPTEAALSIALLVVLPPVYGNAHIFSYAESFMTPRLPSEAFVLGSIAAALCGRSVLTVACLAAAALLHPIMAAAGIVLLFAMHVGLPRPRLAIALPAAGFVGLIVCASFTPIGPIARFDTGWFDLLYNRGQYLFPSRWPLADWAHASVPLATLAAAAIAVNRPQARSISFAALIIGLSGIAVSLVGADLFHVVLIAQAQPWRWLWLSNALAVLILPLTLGSCWSAGGVRRSAAVMLAAAWVCIDEPYAPVIGALAVATAAATRRVTDQRVTRLIFIGAWMVLGLGMLALAGYVLRIIREVALVAPDTRLYDSPFLLELRRWKAWQAGGVVPAVILLGAWWATQRRRSLVGALAVSALGIGLCAAFGRFAWNAWTRVDLPPSLYARFAPWREIIPKRAQVLWPDAGFPVWYLLERANYWSRSQTAASVYSEDMARELARREWVMTAIRDSTHDPRAVLALTCRDNPRLDYYIAAQDMGPTPFPVIGDPKGTGAVRLYRCADFRR